MTESLDYLRKCLEACPFRPYPWDGEDRNIGAFRSREELVAWYCQPPAPDGTPYRDRGFYTRARSLGVMAPRIDTSQVGRILNYFQSGVTSSTNRAAGETEYRERRFSFYVQDTMAAIANRDASPNQSQEPTLGII